MRLFESNKTNKTNKTNNDLSMIEYLLLSILENSKIQINMFTINKTVITGEQFLPIQQFLAILTATVVLVTTKCW